MRPEFINLLYVGVGGFLGANARYVLSAWVAVAFERLLGYEFPYGTLFVNVTGSFMLAIFGVWVARQANWPENIRLLVATGFFGAFTTFSTYANESITLIRGGDWPLGWGNIVLTNGLCLVAVIAGLWLANR